MTYKEFYNKLHPFFTDDQIDNLDYYALECAKNAHEDMNLSDIYLNHIGRDFVCNLLAEMLTDSDPVESITNICGEMFSVSSYYALKNCIIQMDSKW